MRNTLTACATVVALASAISCSGHTSLAHTSQAVQQCVATWNHSPTSSGHSDAALLWNDLAGTPAVLVEAKTKERCEVRIGAVGSLYLFSVFLYGPGKRRFEEISSLEGKDKAANLPPWNAKVREGGDLTLGRP